MDFTIRIIIYRLWSLKMFLDVWLCFWKWLVSVGIGSFDRLFFHFNEREKLKKAQNVAHQWERRWWTGDTGGEPMVPLNPSFHIWYLDTLYILVSKWVDYTVNHLSLSSIFIHYWEKPLGWGGEAAPYKPALNNGNEKWVGYQEMSFMV